MLILDANMILRYLLNDNSEMADQAEKYIEQHEAHVTVEVMFAPTAALAWTEMGRFDDYN